jgi:hypothetical protein
MKRKRRVVTYNVNIIIPPHLPYQEKFISNYSKEFCIKIAMCELVAAADHTKELAVQG